MFLFFYFFIIIIFIIIITIIIIYKEFYNSFSWSSLTIQKNNVLAEMWVVSEYVCVCACVCLSFETCSLRETSPQLIEE